MGTIFSDDTVDSQDAPNLSPSPIKNEYDPFASFSLILDKSWTLGKICRLKNTGKWYPPPLLFWNLKLPSPTGRQYLQHSLMTSPRSSRMKFGLRSCQPSAERKSPPAQDTSTPFLQACGWGDSGEAQEGILNLPVWSPHGLQQLILVHLVTTFNVRAEEELRTIRLGNCKHLSNKDGEVIFTLLLPRNTEVDTGGGFVIGLKIIS